MTGWTLYHCSGCGVPLGVLTQVKARTVLQYGGDFKGKLREPCPFCGARVSFLATTRRVDEILPTDKIKHHLRLNVILQTAGGLKLDDSQRPALLAAVRDLARRQGWPVVYVEAGEAWLMVSLLVDPYHAPHTAVSFIMAATTLTWGGSGELWDGRYTINAGKDVDDLVKLREGRLTIRP